MQMRQVPLLLPPPWDGKSNPFPTCLFGSAMVLMSAIMMMVVMRMMMVMRKGTTVLEKSP